MYLSETGDLYYGDSDRRKSGQLKNKADRAKANAKKWRENNKEHRAEYARGEYQKSLSGWYRSVKAGAKARGIPFELELGDLYLPEVCPVLGIPIIRTPGNRTDNAPSVDRIDSTKGYTKDNIRVISWRANDLKRNATLGELKSIVAYMEKVLA